MNSQTRQTIEQCSRASHDGSAHFGQIVGWLVEAGVESYFADYRAGRTTYYLPDGESLTLDLPDCPTPIAETFDAAGIQAAIRGAQQGLVKYPEFKHLSRAAGCIGYVVWLAGRHVSYFGRRGEVHVERFPGAD